MKKLRFPIVLILFFLVGIFFLFPLTSVQAIESPWPMFQHDVQHTGRSAFAGPAVVNNISASDFGLVGSSFTAILQPVVGSDKTIYFGIKEPEPKLYAMNPDGTKKWEAVLDGWAIAIALGPDNVIYASIRDKGIVAFDSDGAEKWRFYPDGASEVSAATVGEDGIIYFTDYSNLYCINPDGSQNWATGNAPRGGEAFGGPAIGADSTIYVVWTGFLGGVDLDRGQLIAYNSDGTVKWRTPLEYRAGAPIVDSTNSIIYVTIGTSGPLGTTRSVLAFGFDGVEKWRSEREGGSFLSALSMDNFLIQADNWSRYVGESWGSAVEQPMSQIKAFDSSGNVVWTIGPEPNSRISTQPISDKNGNIYFGKTIYEESRGGDGWWFPVIGYKLYSVDKNGAINWSYDVPGEFLSGLAIGGSNNIFVPVSEGSGATKEAIIYSFGAAVSISKEWSFDKDFQYNLDNNYSTIEGIGHLQGTADLYGNQTLSIKGSVTLNGSLPSAIPEIYLVATDGESKELNKRSINFGNFTYNQLSPNTYQFSVTISDVTKPINNGHYELSVLTTYGAEKYHFFVRTHSLINNHYLRLTEKDPEGQIFNVAVILAETSDVPHISSSVTEQPCKLIPKKTYAQGHNKEYYQDLLYCVADYHKENSFGRVNLKFTIYDNDGRWFKTTKNEKDYLNKEDEFVKDAIDLATNDGINLSNQDIVIVLHSGTSSQKEKNKLTTETWSSDDQLFGCPPYKIIVAEDDLVGGWAHEIGHVVGALTTPENTIIPDLYNMGNIKEWDLMAKGSWNGGLLNTNGTNPPYMSSYIKEFLQWLNYDIHPKSAYGEYWINSLETSNYGDKVFRYNLSDNTTDESPKYYILETRNRNLRTWDSSLPGLPIIGDKNLVLYYIDTKGLPEYGYVPEGIGGYQEGMVWNQYRYATIPGSGSVNDGVLNPLINETYRDLDSLVKFSAITDRTVDDKYEIQARIEEITYDSFTDKFWGVVLRPTSLFRNTTKKTIIQNSTLAFSSPCLSRRYFIIGTIEKIEPAPPSMRGSEGWLEPVPDNYFIYKIKSSNGEISEILVEKSVTNKYSFKSGDKITTFGELGPDCWLWSRAIYRTKTIVIFLIVASLIIIGLIWLFVSSIKKKGSRKILKTILKISFFLILAVIVLFLIFILLIYFKIIVPSYATISYPVSAESSSFIPSNPPLEPTTLPDLDLHLYCDDGKHIGMNYQTGEYENQIPGAIISGDNQDAPEWIFIPKDITNCHYVVSSYDNQRFLKENPEIAQQIEDTTDSYEVYARYIDPQSDIYTSSTLTEEIKPGEKLEQPINGTADISVSPAKPLSLLGDVNFDCKVNTQDLILVRNKLNKDVNIGDNWQADVNKDGKLNVLDLITVRNNLDKTCEFSQKTWPIPGDANFDCKVNSLDLVFIRNYLNKDPKIGDNWKADVNQDNKIDTFDLVFVRNHLNTSCP